MTMARTAATHWALAIGQTLGPGWGFTPIAYVNPDEAPVTLTFLLLLSR